MVETPDPSFVLGGDPDVLRRVVAHERGVLRGLPSRPNGTTSTSSTFSRYLVPVDADKRRARALYKLGLALFRLHQFEEAAEPLEEAEQAARLLPGWESVWVGARCHRVAALLVLKRYAEVVDLTEDFVGSGGWGDELKAVQTALHTRLVALKALDRWRDAAVTALALRESLHEEQTSRTRKHLREALEIEAWVAQEAGDPESGLPPIDEAIALAAEEQDREPLSRALMQRAELLYAAGRNAEAREAFQTIIDTFRDAPEDYAISAVAIARGLKLRLRVGLRRPKRSR